MRSDVRSSVLHVTNIPTPYRLPQYRAFAAALDGDGVDLAIYFIGAGKRPRQWTFAPEDFGGIETIFGNPAGGPLRRALGITRAIDQRGPDVVVLAWAMDLEALLVLLHCRARGIYCIVYTGETDEAAAQRSYAGVRDAFRSIFLRVASGFVVYGTAAARYLRNRGVAAEKISAAINVVDTEFFRARVEALHADGSALSARSTYRDEDGVPFDWQILFVGELIELKGLPLLIAALARTGRRDIALHFVGDGPQEKELRAAIDHHGLARQVFFHGYRQKPDLPAFYAMVDLFVFPSLKDVFGLVMVEAAAAALPVIGSSLSGGSIDVIDEGVNGEIVDPRDEAAFAASIDRLCSDHARSREMGEASRRIAIERLTPAVSARGYLAAIRRGLSGSVAHESVAEASAAEGR